MAHNPQEFEEKLARFAESQSAKHNIAFEHKAVLSHDPAIELDETLQDAAHQIGADLIQPVGDKFSTLFLKLDQLQIDVRVGLFELTREQQANVAATYYD